MRVNSMLVTGSRKDAGTRSNVAQVAVGASHAPLRPGQPCGQWISAIFGTLAASRPWLFHTEGPSQLSLAGSGFFGSQ